MRLRRTACVLLALVSVLGIGGCGGQGNTSTTSDTPLPIPTVSSTSPTTPAAPTDPAAATKAKIMADYKTYIAARSRGIVSNNPTFPYEQVMTGNALSAIKSVVTGSQMAGTKYSGGIRFVKGEVAALNLRSKPATAMLQACIYDGLKAASKSGKVTSSSIETSSEDRLVLIDGRWKATETKSLDKNAEAFAISWPSGPGCA
jgi:hypothetical protein